MFERSADNDQFKTFLGSHAVGVVDQLNIAGKLKAENISDAVLMDALFFMKDVELYQANCVDLSNATELDYDPDEHRETMQLNKQYARDINYVMERIHLGDTDVILALSELELADINEHGISQSPEFESTVCERKWGAFLRYMYVTVPDTIPEEFMS